MAYASEAVRRLTVKLNSMLGKKVSVTTTSGKRFSGVLAGIDPSSMTLILENAVEEGSPDSSIPLVVVSGNVLAEIYASEESLFKAREFAEFIVKYGGIARHQVKLYDDVNVVEVGGVRVTENGVEGSGILAQKIYTLYREYMRRKGAGE